MAGLWALASHVPPGFKAVAHLVRVLGPAWVWGHRHLKDLGHPSGGEFSDSNSPFLEV